MVKVFALLPSRTDISTEQFHTHWAGTHAELAMRIRTLKQYVQSHRIAPGVAGLEGAPYEGIAELWFDNVELAAGMATNPDYNDYAEPDIDNFIDAENLAFVMTSEEVVRDGGRAAKDDKGAKITLLLRRADGVSTDDVASYLADFGPRLAERVPDALRITVSTALPENYVDGAQPAFDAIVELRFADADGLQSAWDDAGDTVLEDLDHITDRAQSYGFYTEEVRVIWPEAVPANA